MCSFFVCFVCSFFFRLKIKIKLFLKIFFFFFLLFVVFLFFCLFVCFGGLSSFSLSFFFFFFFALACERSFIKNAYSIESRRVIGPENILFAGGSVDLLARKFYRLRQ